MELQDYEEDCAPARPPHHPVGIPIAVPVTIPIQGLRLYYSRLHYLSHYYYHYEASESLLVRSPAPAPTLVLWPGRALDSVLRSACSAASSGHCSALQRCPPPSADLFSSPGCSFGAACPPAWLARSLARRKGRRREAEGKEISVGRSWDCLLG